jgi:hypothetical protein
VLGPDGTLLLMLMMKLLRVRDVQRAAPDAENVSSQFPH